MKNIEPRGVRVKADPLRSRIQKSYDPRATGRRIPGGRSLDHLALIRFPAISLVIIGLAAGPALLASLAQASYGLDAGTANIIKWAGVALAMVVLLGEGVRRFSRKPAGRQVKQKKGPTG